MLGRFEDEFIEERMHQLQLWVDRLCRHPVIASSDVLHHFLTCTEEKVNKFIVITLLDQHLALNAKAISACIIGCRSNQNSNIRNCHCHCRTGKMGSEKLRKMNSRE